MSRNTDTNGNTNANANIKYKYKNSLRPHHPYYQIQKTTSNTKTTSLTDSITNTNTNTLCTNANMVSSSIYISTKTAGQVS